MEHNYQLWSDFLDFLRAILHPEKQPINGLSKSLDVNGLKAVSQMRPSASELLQMPFILRGKQEDDLVEAALSKPKQAANLPDGLSHRTMSSPITILQTSPIKKSNKEEEDHVIDGFKQSSKFPNQIPTQTKFPLPSKLNEPPRSHQTSAFKGKALFLDDKCDDRKLKLPHSTQSTPNVLSPRSLSETMGFE